MSETYLMEDAREARRLATKVDADAWVETYLAPRVAGRMRILDAGCGPATIAAAVARTFPRVGVVALDQSAARVEAAKATLARFRNAEAVRGTVEELPFANDSFDLVYSRFVFEYLDDKERAAAELGRVCRPGGTVLLQDLDGQLVSHYPPDAELEIRIAAALRRLEPTGFDPFVGRKLFSLLRGTGLDDCGVSAESYHLIVGPIAPEQRAQWELKLDVAASSLRAHGVVDAGALSSDLLAYLDREDTITFSQLFTAWGTKREPEVSPLRVLSQREPSEPSWPQADGGAARATATHEAVTRPPSVRNRSTRAPRSRGARVNRSADGEGEPDVGAAAISVRGADAPGMRARDRVDDREAEPAAARGS